MGDYRQLKMYTSLKRTLPEMGALPDRMALHTADEHSRAAWNWIIRASFGDDKWDYKTTIEDDPTCAPERTFFVSCHSADIATTAARIMEDGTGRVHMVGTHPTWTGLSAARYTVLAAMKSLQDAGVTDCYLSTDDFRKPAIKIYKELGFAPCYEPDDQEMIDRWAAIERDMVAYRKKEKKPILLWPDGDAPDTAACGSQAQPSLMPYPVAGSKGAVIVCPGGGYHIKACHEGAPIARAISASGVSAFVLDYRVQPFTSVDTPIGDGLRAVRLLRSMGYEKVAILGFSAGGHISGMAAVRGDAGNPDAADPVERFASRPDAFVPCYGATSFYRFRAHPHDIIGAGDWKKAADYSAECCVTRDTPPAFIWHTADDNVVPVESAYDLARALAAHGVPCEMHIYPHGPHGLGQATGYPDIQQWPDLLGKWLISLGFGA